MTLNSSDMHESVTLFDLGDNRYVSVNTLKSLLPDIETALFFAKVYGLDHEGLGRLLVLFNTNISDVLRDGGHSTELQSYIVDVVTPAELQLADESTFQPYVPVPDLVLPEVWAQLEVTVAESIAETAEKLGDVLDELPGKQGKMIFATLAQLNRQRPIIGDYRAQIQHPHKPSNLVILDDSGSMSEPTIRALAEDVVALGWKADAHFAMVSTTTRYWEPGTYSVQDVLDKAEYWGTQYETLEDVLKSRPWNTVITIADYDSSQSAKNHLAKYKNKISIGTVLDISLVSQPTFLSECVGQFADEVRPILIRGRYQPNRW